MKNVLVICPYERDRRELSKFSSAVNLIFDELSQDWLEKLTYDFGDSIDCDNILSRIDHIVEYYDNREIDAVISSGDYPGCLISGIVAKRLNLIGPRPQSVLLLQHKYYAREMQKKVVPDVVPQFLFIDPKKPNYEALLPFPFFAKPVKAYFSLYADQINSLQEFKHYLTKVRNLDIFLKPFNCLLQRYTDFEYDGNGIIIEELLTGIQLTLEGYVKKGTVFIIGIVDSIMYPGTISFQRFEYPSSLSQEIQQRMAIIAEKIIVASGLDNSFFNIEFMYNPEKNSIHIIEINPRIASQFADLYEKVDGINSYERLLELAADQKLLLNATHKNEAHNGLKAVVPSEIRHSPYPAYAKATAGSPTINLRSKLCSVLATEKYKVAASCVLRTFTDSLVVQLPSEHDITQLKKLIPDISIEITVTLGKRLSETFQDGKSYRYAVLNIGAFSKAELLATLEQCKKLLPFKFVS